MTPNVADTPFGIEDDELFAGFPQVVTHREACLPAADDHCGNRFDAVGIGRRLNKMHALCSHDLTVEAHPACGIEQIVHLVPAGMGRNTHPLHLNP